MTGLMQGLTVRAVETPADLALLEAFDSAAQPDRAARALELHRRRPRYRDGFIQMALIDGSVVGYALLAHERRRLGAVALDVGVVEHAQATHERSHEVLQALVGVTLAVCLEEDLPVALLHGPPSLYASYGFAPYRLRTRVALRCEASAHAAASLRLEPYTMGEEGFDELAPLYESSYGNVRLSEVRTPPDWRSREAVERMALVVRDSQGRALAYAELRSGESSLLALAEAAAADDGAAWALLLLLRERHPGCEAIVLPPDLPLAQPLVRAALQLGGQATVTAPSDPAEAQPLGGVVDLTGLLGALRLELERRLGRSRYAGWSGRLAIEIETERTTLAFHDGRVVAIDGSQPADVRLRRVALPALAQLCLGYRAASDLRATGGLDCDDSGLGLIDTLFPVEV